ncbi:hypothetical protein [Klebsiella sp. BIGb0407]|uniref:hypothetical protein n=1 Tax=Klebsiella sp. BIGb0407 TaxID=2940603 RepID=UPI00216A6F7C|nr:hypothetical protein [Klebsiella sp. BIGb0407]MCS3430884.1 hypothetical protein [Klebsiella sp. BIGb0407]
MIGLNLESSYNQMLTDINNYWNNRDHSNFKDNYEELTQKLGDNAILKKNTYNPLASIEDQNHFFFTKGFISALFTNKNTFDLRSAIKSCIVRHDPNFCYEQRETFVALLDYKKTATLSDSQEHTIRKSIFSLEKRVRDVVRSYSDSPGGPRVTLHQEHSQVSTETFCREGLRFNCESGRPFPIENIFATLNEKFSNSAGPERCLIATIANELKNAWLEKTPFGGSREAILKIPETYVELFLWGKVAKDIAISSQP